MVESETIVAKSDVGFYPKEKPGMAQALKGQLVLTNRRLVYIRFLGGKYATAKTADYSDRIEEGLRNEGSFEVPLNEITEATANKVLGTPYFRLRYGTSLGEKTCSFVFVSAMNAMAAGGILGLAYTYAKSPSDQLAKAIEQLKATPAPPSPQKGNAQKHCPHCGGHQFASGDTFCPNCGTKL